MIDNYHYCPECHQRYDVPTTLGYAVAYRDAICHVERASYPILGVWSALTVLALESVIEVAA
jgi:hypothetical protein